MIRKCTISIVSVSLYDGELGADLVSWRQTSRIKLDNLKN